MPTCQMSKSKIVKVNGVPQLQPVLICGLAAQTDSLYCPRHTYLHNIALQQKAAKDAYKRDIEDAGVTGFQPRTRAALIAAGYQYTGNNVCSGCGERIEWWLTPKGKKCPYNPMANEASFSQVHFATCTRAKDFRRAS